MDLLKSLHTEVDNYPRSRAFLDTVGQNSMRTRNNYRTGLIHLERFLHDRFNGEYNTESVIDLILQNYMNVYELLDNFVSYEGSKKNQEKNKPQSIRTHLIGIKSYFAYYDIEKGEDS